MNVRLVDLGIAEDLLNRVKSTVCGGGPGRALRNGHELGKCGLGCAPVGVWERLLFIELLGLGTEKMLEGDGCTVGCAGVGLDGSDAGAGA